jgi:hypothetical protein
MLTHHGTARTAVPTGETGPLQQYFGGGGGISTRAEKVSTALSPLYPSHPPPPSPLYLLFILFVVCVTTSPKRCRPTHHGTARTAVPTGERGPLQLYFFGMMSTRAEKVSTALSPLYPSHALPPSPPHFLSIQFVVCIIYQSQPMHADTSWDSPYCGAVVSR